MDSYFSHWDGSYTNVTSDRTIRAQYERKSYTVTFQAGEQGLIASGDTVQTIEHGQAATAPVISANEGWAFTGWDRSFRNVTEDMTVTAVYEEIVEAAIAPDAHWLFDRPYGIDVVNVVGGRTAALIGDCAWGEGWAKEHFVRLKGGRQAIEIPMDACTPQAGTVALWV